MRDVCTSSTGSVVKRPSPSFDTNRTGRRKPYQHWAYGLLGTVEPPKNGDSRVARLAWQTRLVLNEHMPGYRVLRLVLRTGRTKSIGESQTLDGEQDRKSIRTLSLTAKR